MTKDYEVVIMADGCLVAITLDEADFAKPATEVAERFLAPAFAALRERIKATQVEHTDDSEIINSLWEPKDGH